MVFKIILLILVVFCFAFVFYSRRFNNPYKFYFIFGKKGSGKSCYMVKQMLRYKKLGYTIYTDMPVFIEGARIIRDANEMFKVYTPEPHSAIFLDEIGLTWNNRQFKNFDKKILEWFKLQRKYKCVVYANSQSWDTDLSLRQLADGLIMQTNIGNVISVSRPILRSMTVTDASLTGESKIVDQLSFSKPWHWKFYFMPKYFKYFKSFEAPERPPMPYGTALSSVDVPKRSKYKGCDKKLRDALDKEGL